MAMAPDLFQPAYAYAVIDCETSGLFAKDTPDHIQNDCRLASFGVVKASPTWVSQSEWQVYVKPDGWKMHPEASKANGLTDEFLHEYGRPVREALDYFVACLAEDRAVGAFNVKFDIRVMHSEMMRAGMETLWEKTWTICAMLASTGVVRAKREDGRIKTPKLHEAMAHFKLPQIGAHTALGDAISAMQILRMLERIGVDVKPRPYKLTGPGRKKKEIDPVDFSKEATAARRAPNWLRPTDSD